MFFLCTVVILRAYFTRLPLVPIHKTNAGTGSPLCRMLETYNKNILFCIYLIIFANSLIVTKKHIIDILSGRSYQSSIIDHNN